MPVYNFDMTTARSTFATFDVSDPKMWILRADTAFELLMNGGEIIPWPAGLIGEIDHCCVPQGTMGIRNNAGSGLVTIFTSSDYCLNIDGGGGLAALLIAQSTQISEATLSHSFVETASTNPQENVAVRGDGCTWGVSAGGVAGQNINNVIPYYGGLTASVLASVAALNGGRLIWSVGRMMNMDVLVNAMQTTPPTFTRSPRAMLDAGLWTIETDVLLETPTIGVPGHLIASFGVGLRIDQGTGANGVGGLRGVGLCWSNGLSNNNWHLIAADGTNVTRDVDTGILATGQHRQLAFQYGTIGGVALCRAVIDGVGVGVLTDLGMTMATISGFAGGWSLPQLGCGKMQINQNGNQVSLRSGGYTGYRLGRAL